MRRPPADRRRIRPSLAAAVVCGILGGSLVGVGALGFDKVEVAAAPCVQAPAATPLPADAPEGAIREASLTDSPTYSANSTAIGSGPLGPDTTIVPDVGPRKPGQGIPCEPGPVVIPLPGPDDPGSEPVVDEPDVEVPGTDPSPSATPLPSSEPDPEPENTPTPTSSATPTPTTSPITTPTPTPMPTTVVRPTPRATPRATPQATPRPTPVRILPPLVTANPVLPAPSTSKRGYTLASRPRTQTPGRTGTITRPEVIARAVSWVTQRVPYSQTRWWTDLNGSYRQDCSGYVSMAWRTDQRVNYWTGNLGTISRRIASSSMQPGDILLLPGKHTVIFLGWGNQQRTKFHLFEEYRTGTPARFVRNASLSYYLDRGYGAYRYHGIREVVSLNSLSVPLVNPPPAASSSMPDGSGEDTVALLSAESELRTTTASSQQQWTIQQLIADLPATDWSPDVADEFTAESELAALDTEDALTPVSLPDTPVEDLVAAQQAIDQAEQQRLAGLNQRTLTISESRTSGAGVILAAGLGLLFIAVPLGATCRRAWTGASTAGPLPQGKEGH